MSFKTHIHKNVETRYKQSKFPQRRNPTYKLKLKNPILCLFCEEKYKSSIGMKKKWKSLNKLHGHCAFAHPEENFRDYLISLATKIIKGELF